MDSKPKENKIIFSSIVLIFLAIFMLILAGILFVSSWMITSGDFTWDVPNWLGLLIEIGIGIGIAFAIVVYERNQQKKFQIQQDNISELVTEIKHLTEEQKKFREGRHRWAIHMMMNELRILKLRIQERKTNEGLSTIEPSFKEFSIKQYTREAQTAIHNLEQISNQAGDVVEPIYLHEISEIANIAKYHLEKEKWHNDDLTQDSNFFKLIDSLTNTFEKIYPPV